MPGEPCGQVVTLSRGCFERVLGKAEGRATVRTMRMCIREGEVMIDIFQIKFPKERLAEMSVDERSLFFLLGYAANQIAVFRKMTVFSSNIDSDSPVKSRVEGAQTQMLVRHYVGVVAEAWELVEKRFLNKPIGKEYRARLSSKGLEAITRLQGHFGGSNLLNRIRNEYAFHHPYNSDVDAGYAAAASSSDFDEEWNWYLAQENINCFYFISDVVVVHSMLQAFGDDLIEVQKKMHRELNLVADELIQFASQFFDALLRKYFSPEIIAEVVEKIEGAPVALDVQLPFYVEPPSDHRLTEDGFIKEGH
jgi:hypothetical protein